MASDSPPAPLSGRPPIRVEGKDRTPASPENVPPRASRIDLIRGIVGLMLAALVVYAAGLGAFEEFYHRGLVICLSAVVVTLLFPLASKNREASTGVRSFLWSVDLAIVAGIVLAISWFFSVNEDLWTGVYVFSRADRLIALLGMLILIELTRRAMGNPLALLGASAIVYCLYGDRLPWIFRHAGFSLEETIQTIWYSLDGVFGIAAGVMVNLIYVYVVFGVLLEATGAGPTLLRISTSLTGSLRGGPAHAAILSSGLFGTISGSVTANVVGTGVFTIPMIKRRGFGGAFAGALEAAASSGGQFLPPVMGAAAFMIAELTGESYLKICAAAVVPALFYYGSLFCAVGVEAARKRIEPVPPSDRPQLTRQDWGQSLTFLVPIGVIIFVLLIGRSPAMAGFWAILSSIATSFLLNPRVRRDPMALIVAAARGGQSGARIMVAVATIGILIGTMNLTGLAMRFSNMILAFGDGSLLVSLFLTMAASLILGMGLPTLPAYLIIVLMMGPTLGKLGVPLIALHLFIFYYGVFSAITPPVAIAAYAAAPIAEAKPLETGLIAIRLAIIGMTIPFVFIYNPSLLLVLEFRLTDFLWIALRFSAAIWLLTTGLAGFERGPLSTGSRFFRLAAGVFLLAGGLWAQIVALFAGTGLVLMNRLRAERAFVRGSPGFGAG